MKSTYPRSLLVRAIFGWNAREITDEIMQFVGYGPYSEYVIGITDNLEERYIAHGRPALWRTWNPESEDVARQVERTFLSPLLGMRGGVGGDTNGRFVYVFRSPLGHLLSQQRGPYGPCGGR